MTTFLSVPNWDELQHYKDRTPPWIKLHNELLENYEFECLPDASKAHLLCIWLLASRTENKMKPDPRWIGRKIGANSPVDLDSLIASGFLQLNQPLQTVEHDASAMLHTVEQSACTEREGEESRGERYKDMSAKADADNDHVIEQGDHAEQPKPANNDHIEIFNYWRDAMNKDPAKTSFTAKRLKAVKARLKDFSVDDIKTAILNCSKDPWSMGHNDRGKPFNDLELICRDSGKVESFLIEAKPKPPARNINSIGDDFSPPAGWKSR